MLWTFMIHLSLLTLCLSHNANILNKTTEMQTATFAETTKHKTNSNLPTRSPTEQLRLGLQRTTAREIDVTVEPSYQSNSLSKALRQTNTCRPIHMCNINKRSLYESLKHTHLGTIVWHRNHSYWNSNKLINDLSKLSFTHSAKANILLCVHMCERVHSFQGVHACW